jgi:hypothetical protein
MRNLPILTAAILALLCNQAGAWPVYLYTDAEVVKQAELIAVGHLKEGSLSRIPHPGSYEHRAVLIISRVIKGKANGQELPIIIHYGLLPVPARYEAQLDTNHFAELDHIPPFSPDETIRIYEDNPSEGFSRPSGDIRKDQIWLLRLHEKAGMRDDPQIATTNAPGVWEPEDIQPLSKEQELEKPGLTK